MVRPRLSPSGISGLDTLVSGAFLGIEPGQNGHAQYEFKGLEEPPIGDPSLPGRKFILRASQVGGLGQGSPIYFRGISVGETLGSQLSPAGDDVEISIFVHAPFVGFVHPSTRFWNASGVSISAGPEGIKANIESLQALVAGGIAFDTPKAEDTSSVSPPGAQFRLYDDAGSAQTEPRGPSVKFLVNFPGPVHGLVDGSPVELKGRLIGRVTEIHLVYDPKAGTISTPATIEIDPERIEGFTPDSGEGGVDASTAALIARLVGTGLRAELGTSNLLTGQRMVALDTDPAAKPAALGSGGAFPEIPATEGGGLDAVTRSASRALDAIAAMPLQQIGANLRDLMGHLDGIVGSPEARRTVKSLDATLAHLDKLTSDLDTQAPALIKSLTETSDAATRTIQVLGGEGGRGTDLRGLLHELEEAARSFRSLADMLQDHPEALVKGRDEGQK